MLDRAEDPDDVTLIARIAARDEDALEALFVRHYAPMSRHAALLSGDAALAEDALQEAFVAVWQHASTYRGPSPRAWLYTVARNALRRQIRMRSADSDALSLEELGERAGWGDSEAGSRVLAAIESRVSVREALAGLDPSDREVLSLIDVEGLSLDEAATALDLTLAALKSRLHRARLRFVARLNAEDDHGP
ncbi:MAG: RNA polymerase sigma factor [Byssovorax sp.]